MTLAVFPVRVRQSAISVRKLKKKIKLNQYFNILCDVITSPVQHQNLLSKYLILQGARCQ